MANIVNNDTIRVRIYNENPSRAQTAVNTLYYLVTDATGTWSVADVAAAMSLVHAPLFRGWQSPATRYAGTGVARVRPTATPQTTSTAGAGPGNLGSVTFPTQVTGLIGGKAADYHTGSPTAKHPDGIKILASMRLYISFPSNQFLGTTDGKMPDVMYNQLIAMAGAIIAPRTITKTGGASMTMQPMIRYSVRPAIGEPPVYFYVPVDTRRLSRLWATQRRRGDRGQQELSPV